LISKYEHKDLSILFFSIPLIRFYLLFLLLILFYFIFIFYFTFINFIFFEVFLIYILLYQIIRGCYKYNRYFKPTEHTVFKNKIIENENEYDELFILKKLRIKMKNIFKNYSKMGITNDIKKGIFYNILFYF
jgi:Ca2+/Na+ antiporter